MVSQAFVDADPFFGLGGSSLQVDTACCAADYRWCSEFKCGEMASWWARIDRSSLFAENVHTIKGRLNGVL